MAFGKKIADELGLTHKKEHKFMDGLKNWISSPGGMVTIVGFIIITIYLHHRHK